MFQKDPDLYGRDIGRAGEYGLPQVLKEPFRITQLEYTIWDD